MTIQKVRDKIKEANVGIKIINRNTVKVLVDDEWEIFTRDDRYGGHPLSGWANYGSVGGDHRMIRTIYEDVQEVFKQLDEKEVA